METQTVHVDNSGHYSAVLGSTRAEGLPASLFNNGQAKWISVQAEGQQEQPRSMLISVPYALKASDADTLGGKPLSAFLLANANTANPQQSETQQTPGRNSSVAKREQTSLVDNGGTSGSTNFLAKWTSSAIIGNASIYDDGSRVGIGTSTPSTALEVNGSIKATSGIQFGDGSVQTSAAVTCKDDQFGPGDMASRINACIAALPATGGVADARGFQGNQSAGSTLMLGTANKPVRLLLGAVAINSTASPAISCPLGGSSSIEGLSRNATQVIFTASGANGIDWGCSRGTINNLSIQGQAGTHHGLTLIASGTTSIQHNTFSNLQITGATISGNNGIRLIADNLKALVSFNEFINVEIIGFDDSVYVDSSGSSGPTSNHFLGGHLRKTSPSGSGIHVVHGSNNSSYGMSISGQAVGISLGAGTGNFQDHGSTLEANGLDILVNSGSADNSFLGTAYSTRSDGGIRTIFMGTAYSKLFLNTLTGGQLDINTEDPNSNQQPVIHFEKSISSADYGYAGQISNNLSQIGQDTFGLLGTGGDDVSMILDDSVGLPHFRIWKKNSGYVFSVDAKGRTVSSGFSAIAGATPPSDGTIYSTNLYTNTLSPFSGTNIDIPSGKSISIGSGSPIKKAISTQALIDFPSVMANTCADSSNIALGGAADGDIIELGVPASAASAMGLIYSAYVSAPNVVKVRACNMTQSSVNPAGGYFRIAIWQY